MKGDLWSVFLYEQTPGGRVMLFDEAQPSSTDPKGRVEVSRGTFLRSEGDVRFLTHFGTVLQRWPRGDLVGERFGMAMLCETKIARPSEVAAAFEAERMVVFRARRAVREGGVAALMPRKRGPKGPRLLQPATMKAIRRLHASGKSQREIAGRVGISQSSVAVALRRLGLQSGPRPAAQMPLIVEAEATDAAPAETSAAAPSIEPHGDSESPAAMEAPSVSVVADRDVAESAERAAGSEPLAIAAEPASSQQEVAAVVETPTLADDRVPGPGAVVERAFARLGLTPDGEAVHCFEPARNVRHAGMLLGVAAMLSLGLLESARAVYGKLQNGIYGLRATVLVLFAMALLRVKRAEGLKGVAPEALGRVLGLARVPEVKTLRRKLREIADFGKAHELVRALFARWRDLAESALGFLYVDGHVRVYHGQRALPKAHVAQLRLAVPATTDYYVNDAEGEPLFFVTARANEGLVKVLPELLGEVRGVIGERRATVVFDRGGWSPKLFGEILAQGFDFMTYRKGKFRKLPKRLFETRSYRANGRVYEYCVASRTIRLKGCGQKLRLIAVLRDDGRQTQIITSRHDLEPAYVAYRMFNRWRQENYFKYMVEEFALDALVDYQDEPADPERSVPNPKWARATERLKAARARLARLEQHYGAAAADNVEAERPTIRGFKIANGETGRALRAARQRCERLEAIRARIAKRVAVREVLGDRRCVQLARERKTFTDAIKAAAYRAEGVLLRLLRPQFARPDEEGRAFLREAFDAHADLELTDHGLHVRLEPMSAPRFTRALAALCDEVNKLHVCFPETAVALTFSVTDEAASEKCDKLP